MKKIETFLPPGVQQKLFAHFRSASIPRALGRKTHDKIMALWQRRNNCAESDIEAIDAEMFTLVTENKNEP